MCIYLPQNTIAMRSKFSFILLFILFALSFSSCQHRYPASLVEADSLMYTDPKAALAKLDSLSAHIDTTKEADVMYLRLLQSMTKDKLFLPFGTLDSIQAFVEKSESLSDSRLLPRAYYLLGRKLCDMREISQAFANYRKVLDVLSEKGTDEQLKAVTYSQIGYMLAEVGDVESANFYFHQALVSDSIAGNQAGMVLNLRDIAMGEMAMNSSTHAIANLYRALKIVNGLNNEELRNDINLQLANSYLYSTNNLDSVAHFLASSLTDDLELKNIALDFIASEYYWGIEQEDSCRYYLSQVLKFGNVSDKQEATRRLMLMAIEGKNMDGALCLLDNYFDYADTLRLRENKETKQNGMALLNYATQNEQIEKLNEKNFQKFIMLLLLVLSLVVIIFLLCLYYQMSLVSKLKLKNKINELKLSIFSIDNRKVKQKDCIKIKLGLMEYVAVGKCLHDDQWNNLEMMIKNIFPKFKDNLYSVYQLSDTEYHICLLLKIGMETKEIAILISKSKQAVSMSKQRLYCKIANSKTGKAEDLDIFLSEL